MGLAAGSQPSRYVAAWGRLVTVLTSKGSRLLELSDRLFYVYIRDQGCLGGVPRRLDRWVQRDS